MSALGVSEDQKNQYRHLIEGATAGWRDLTLQDVPLDGEHLQNFLSRANSHFLPANKIRCTSNARRTEP
jgi:hypothetical protein